MIDTAPLCRDPVSKWLANAVIQPWIRPGFVASVCSARNAATVASVAASQAGDASGRSLARSSGSTGRTPVRCQAPTVGVGFDEQHPIGAADLPPRTAEIPGAVADRAARRDRELIVPAAGFGVGPGGLERHVARGVARHRVGR